MSGYKEEKFWRALAEETAWCRHTCDERQLKRLLPIRMEARWADREKNFNRRDAQLMLLFLRLENIVRRNHPHFTRLADVAPDVERTEAVYNGVAEGRLWWGNDELTDERGDPVDGSLPSERFYGPRDPEAEVAEDEETIDECEDGPIYGERVDPAWLWLVTKCFECDEERGARYEI